MIYLDYAANTPVDERVLQVFCDETKAFYGNPNSMHCMGIAAKERLNEYINKICRRFKFEECILTSGASEANNLALKGIAHAYKENGRHIISTPLEHSSVSGALTALQTLGWEIDLVNITRDGQVDIEHFKELIRKDTVLVSVCTVDSELGIIQPIHEIADIMKDYPNSFFHTDATQAVGRLDIDLSCADLVTFTPHKFYGLNGSGALLKNKCTVLKPLIDGGMSTTIYRSGTPIEAQAAAMSAALDLAYDEMPERTSHIEEISAYISEGLAKFPQITFNKREKSLPHFINISIKGIKAAKMQETLSNNGICVSTKSACSVPNTPSRAVYSITHDRKAALSSIRISISHLTTYNEADELIKTMGEILNGKISGN